MATFKQMAYIVLDQLKVVSDDSFVTPEHAVFLLSKARAQILKQRYSDIKKEIPESNYQTVCLDMEPFQQDCEDSYLRSKKEVPSILSIGNTSVYPKDYYQANISFVSRDRMKYVGNNRWLKNEIYASIGADKHLYLKSSNPQFLYLEVVCINGIFEDPEELAELMGECDIMDTEFPLEEGLVNPIIELTVKYLSGAVYRPKDPINDAQDTLSDIQAFIRRNMKSNLAKQLDNDNDATSYS